MALESFLWGAAGGAAGAAGVAIAGLLTWRALAGRVFASLMKRLLTDPYQYNLLETLSTNGRVGWLTVLETSLRAEEGKEILRPFGSPRRFPHFDRLLFDVAQLERFPAEESTPVDLQTVIGPAAARPLALDLPLLIAPMAYGFALSGPVKVALAKAATIAGTATSTGEGPFLAEERAAARHLILQYGRNSWAKDPDTLKRVDAVEIQLGLGARGGAGHTVPAAQLDPVLRRGLNLPEGEDAVSSARIPGLESVDDFRALVNSVREAAGGVPVGFKLAAGKNLERDLELAVQAGPDFLDVSGAQGGTWGSSPALQDDFGLPTLCAVARAGRFFARQGLRGRVSLIVGGKLTTPGEFLKAFALGADAVNIGTIALLALTHTQILKVLPWEPPTQLIGYAGSRNWQFDVETGAQSLARFLESCRVEMAQGIRALGKTSHRELSLDDLMAVDRATAELCRVEGAWQASEKPRPPQEPAAAAAPASGSPRPRPVRRPRPLLDR